MYDLDIMNKHRQAKELISMTDRPRYAVEASSRLYGWWHRLTKLMIEHGDTQETLAEKLNVSPGLIGHWLNNKRCPPAKRFEKIANLYKVDLAELMYGEKSASKASLPSNIIDIKNRTPTKYKVLPWIELSQVRAFLDGKLTDNLRKVNIPMTINNVSDNLFVVQAVDDSMVSESNPSESIWEGMILVVDKHANAEAGDDVLADINGSMRICRLAKYGTDLILKALNPKYPNVPFEPGIKIEGVIMQRIIGRDRNGKNFIEDMLVTD